jgi:hypothetical protein
MCPGVFLSGENGCGGNNCNMNHDWRAKECAEVFENAGLDAGMARKELQYVVSARLEGDPLFKEITSFEVRWEEGGEKDSVCYLDRINQLIG